MKFYHGISLTLLLTISLLALVQSNPFEKTLTFDWEDAETNETFLYLRRAEQTGSSCECGVVGGLEQNFYPPENQRPRCADVDELTQCLNGETIRTKVRITKVEICNPPRGGNWDKSIGLSTESILGKPDAKMEVSIERVVDLFPPAGCTRAVIGTSSEQTNKCYPEFPLAAWDRCRTSSIFDRNVVIRVYDIDVGDRELICYAVVPIKNLEERDNKRVYCGKGEKNSKALMAFDFTLI